MGNEAERVKQDTRGRAEQSRELRVAARQEEIAEELTDSIVSEGADEAGTEAALASVGVPVVDGGEVTGPRLQVT